MLYMEKKSKTRKWVIGIFTLLFFAFSGLLFFSPYHSYDGFSYKLVKQTIEINAPREAVFKFLGNSKNASRWSVFVHHINPLNSDSFADGKPGGRRRCFCNADETGRRWDELITEVVPGTKRQLVTYNFKDFPMTAEHLATEQLYESISENKCRLTFTVFFKDSAPGLFETFKTNIAAYTIKSIFEKNMANIKRLVEEENG
jgi:uncharacterized protein YndB with AHSA1/START domain